jgi:hypothetical protein
MATSAKTLDTKELESRVKEMGGWLSWQALIPRSSRASPPEIPAANRHVSGR